MLFGPREIIRRAKSTSDMDELIELSRHESRAVREAVANRTDAPLSVLSELANDEDECVRQAVASNNAVSMEMLLKLSHDESMYVRSMAQKTMKYKRGKSNDFGLF